MIVLAVLSMFLFWFSICITVLGIVAIAIFLVYLVIDWFAALRNK